MRKEGKERKRRVVYRVRKERRKEWSKDRGLQSALHLQPLVVARPLREGGEKVHR